MDLVQGFALDVDLLRAFERGLDPQHPERSKLPARVLGYGEISTAFEIQLPGLQGLALKRLPLFRTAQEVERFRAAYEGYNRLLEEAGLSLPRHGYASLAGDGGQPIFYILQEQLPYPSIGNRAIQRLPREAALALLRRVLQELGKVWRHSGAAPQLQIGLDGQISNWSLVGFADDLRLPEDTPLVYLDTSTPLFRLQGVEQLDVELFLRGAPSFLAWVLRRLYLKDVVNRYYDLRLVAIDLVANLIKEQRPELVAGAVRLANGFFAGEGAEFGVAPLSEEEVRSYYREDAMIWTLYLAARRVDRFIRRRILRRSYPYILPGKVKR